MTESSDLCVVGAGIAGLNALFVASRYLRHDQKVILIDRRRRVGGMWIDTYPYVRLHQPHPIFTAGNIEWTLGRERSYLATKDEVLGHFAHCLDEINTKVTVDARYGWEFVSEEQIGATVRVTCRDADGETRVVETPRLIKAYGLRVTPNQPLELSSSRVHSVSPDYCDVRDGEIRDSDAPVWIIGGGKTAMDTAHAVITRYPGREVNLVAGSGTFFNNRDRFFPKGIRRWWGVGTLGDIAFEMCQRFDGTNEAEVRSWYRSAYGTWLTPQTGNFLLGMLSEAENRTIGAGLNDVIMDHLVDVVDRNDTTDLVLRSGATKTIQPGSWIINCTGYLTNFEHPYEPYVSPGGAVISIQPRSATMHLTSFMAYFTSHLLFLDKLNEIPLYELDMQDLLDKNKPVLPYTLFSLVQYNLGLIFDSVPRQVFSECGLDFDRWYPWHRRTAGALRFVRTHRGQREHLRRTLDTVGERFNVRCGPLVG
ncbi:hypothetical protein M2272_004376 [Mycobacterium frederiksbergense]|uniref:FAD/NAD(P)-binding domain-containing protein n=1 Tax=Mycolicibacterium frederiksbergense TaxID=117567 RepID=A0ABT6L445_9MYCO|nr:FAD-dependent oxidoreductase [Mycolicibacterium frederiksbergense]MDH6197721.1 hypothetical protein [Mycolicibacterium frederiksbergense]